ncbi:MAG: PLP-dependent aminotransferase family protein, partial [Aestuariivirgaceae bacterium]
RQTNIVKPLDWPRYPYPFIYGQVDHRLFPIAEWRECSRQALGTKWLDSWTADSHGNDDPMLVEQIRTRLLPRRGIMAREDEVLVTMGAQHALYLIASLLVSRGTQVGLEDPGYPDVRNIFGLRTNKVQPIQVDASGLITDDRLVGCDLIYTTPSHQAPTTVTMPEARRQELLEAAQRHRILVIEDDYEFETNYVRASSPALKSIDRSSRVIYVGSLSKTLFPGLRLGYLVADRAFIAEARALRRLMVRHPPSNNQRTAALFLALGHHDALVMRLRRAYSERWRVMSEALRTIAPELDYVKSAGGTSYWVRGPASLDARVLAEQARQEGLLLEPGDIYFSEQPSPQNFFRLGFSSIDVSQIEPGIRLLTKLFSHQHAQTGNA